MNTKFLGYNNTKIVYIPVNKICTLDNDKTLDTAFVESYKNSGNFMFHIPIVVKFIENDLEYYFLVSSTKLFNVIKESLPGGDSKVPCFLISYETFLKYGEAIQNQLKLIQNELSKVSLLNQENNNSDNLNSEKLENDVNNVVEENIINDEIYPSTESETSVNNDVVDEDEILEDFINNPKKCLSHFKKYSSEEFKSFVETTVKEYIKRNTNNKKYGLAYWRCIMNVCKQLDINPGKNTKVDYLIGLIYDLICTV